MHGVNMTNTQIALVGITIAAVGVGMTNLTGGFVIFGMGLISLAVAREIKD